MVAKKKTKDEMIAYHKAQLAKLEGKSSELTKDSAGVAELLAAFDKVVTENKMSATDVIKNLSKFKRLGLKIESVERKPRQTKPKKSKDVVTTE